MTSLLRDGAISILAQHRFPELVAARDALGAELAAREMELGQADRSVSFWSRVAFFHDSPDERHVEALEKQVASARAALGTAQRQIDDAVSATWQTCPPLEIVQRVETIIARALADPRCGRVDATLVVDLDALAARIVAVWAPGVDLGGVAAALADDAARASIHRLATPSASHTSLGWQPVARDELLARAATALDASSFASARATLDREAAEHAAVAAQLEQARAAVSMIDKLTPGASPSEAAVDWYASALSQEHQQVVTASETLLHAVEAALAAYPPLAIHAAACAAAAVLRAGNNSLEPVLSVEGALLHVPSAYPRAFFLAALIELRRATDAAFPGLIDLITARSALVDREPSAKRGPYRVEGSVDADAEQHAAPRTTETVFFEELERRGLRSRVSRAVAHSTLLGALGRDIPGAAERVGFFEKLAFWSASDNEQTHAGLEERQRWHRAMVDGLGAECVDLVAWTVETQPLLALHRLLIQVHLRMLAIATTGGYHGSPISCPALGRNEALAAIDALCAFLSQQYGPTGDRDQLMGAVVERLRYAPTGFVPPAGALLSYGQIVDAIAERLRSTPFAALVERVQQARQHHAASIQTANESAARVTFWDTLNVFSDSEAETMRDQYSAQAQAMWQLMSGDIAQANALLDGALGCYAPAEAYYRLLHLRALTAAIRGVMRSHTSTQRVGNTTTTTTTYSCEIVGKMQALAALRDWTVGAMRVFGGAPSLSELVERWVARELR